MKTEIFNKTLVVLVELLLWVMALLTIAWLWDHWILDGPHGVYRWVGMDFAPFWAGVREMLHGANPYSPETTLKIQEVVYGGTAMGEDPMMFVYPAWMFIIIVPFSLITFKWSAILYAGSLLWAMLNFLYLIACNLGNRNFLVRSLWLVLLILGNLPFLVISVTKGQLGYFSLLAMFMSHRIWERRPVLAGIVLGLALIKPTVTVIPTAGFLLWALLKKDWKFISGFTGCMTVLLLTSLLAVGNWIPGYMGMLRITGGMPVFWSLAILPKPWNIIYACFFIGLGVYAFVPSKRKNHDYWFSVTILAGIALTPMRWIYDLFLVILILAERKNLSLLLSVMTGVAILSPWVLVFMPETMRWNMAVVGLPLIWAVTLLVLFAPHDPKSILKLVTISSLRISG